jgi:hypothetical protein
MGLPLSVCELSPHTPPAKYDLQCCSRDHPARSSLERFIVDGYMRAYGAYVVHFADVLVGLSLDPGEWSAAVGYTVAGRRPLFMEQYIDVPVEDLLTTVIGAPVLREDIVEVGNLVAAGSGAARRVIVHMTELLHDLGRSWVVLTLTKSLLNSFVRLGIELIPLVAADPARLTDKGASWGTYYSCEPCVMAASIPLGFRRLLGGTHRRDTTIGAD